MLKQADRLQAVSAHLADIEACLAELDAALASGDTQRIDVHAQQLQGSLSQSLPVMRALGGEPETLPPELQQRLHLMRARCQQQQLAVHRATSSFERTLGVLFPGGSAVFGGGQAGQTAAARALSAYR